MTEYDHPDRRLSADELRRLARYHRWVILTVLAQLGLWGGFLVFGLAGGGLARLRFPVEFTVVLGCVGGIFAFLLYWVARGPFWAAVMGLGSVVPGIGFLVLAAVNSTATRELEANGLRVGLFGADADDIGRDWMYEEDAGW